MKYQSSNEAVKACINDCMTNCLPELRKDMFMGNKTLEARCRIQTSICIFGVWIPIYRTTHYERYIDPLGYGAAHRMTDADKAEKPSE